MNYWLKTAFCFLILLFGQCQVGLAVGPVDPDGGWPSCGLDGICRVNECQEDPDCPNLPDRPSEETSYPIELVDTKCGGKVTVDASNSPFGLAVRRVAARLPSFNAAQKAKNPSFFDAHPSGVTATGHGELKGFGVTMVQGKWPKAVENASGDLDDPTLLFFDKTDKDQDNWKLIGMGYSFKFDTNNEGPPTKISEVTPEVWWIHEAGYHRSPGDGGFTCASDDDLRSSVFDTGTRVDQAGCFGIDKDDLKTREFHVDRKHGRYWALHIWFEPKTLRPTISKTDPWCRQGDDALSVPSCAFFRQGQCFETASCPYNGNYIKCLQDDNSVDWCKRHVLGCAN